MKNPFASSRLRVNPNFSFESREGAKALSLTVLGFASALILSACTPQKSAEMKIGPDDWATVGGDAGKSHHSQLMDITAANVGTLGLAWQAELGTNRVLE